MSEFRHRRGAALVTGATGGIGSAICLLLAQQGARVIPAYRSNASKANQLAAELNTQTPGPEPVQLDLSDADQVTKAVDRAAGDNEGIHTVVHAAGPHVPMRHLSRVDPADMRSQLVDDAAGFFALMHASIEHLRTSEGSAVAITTAATDRFPVRDGLSAGPKGAVETMARGFASEEGRFGVRVNCVGPGMLTDGMAERLIASGDLSDDALEITRSNIPLRRFGSAVDIAEVVCFLASDRASFITGQKVNVDGGYSV